MSLSLIWYKNTCQWGTATHLAEWWKLKRLRISRNDKRMVWTELLYIGGGSVNWQNYFRKLLYKTRNNYMFSLWPRNYTARCISKINKGIFPQKNVQEYSWLLFHNSWKQLANNKCPMPAKLTNCSILIKGNTTEQWNK